MKRERQISMLVKPTEEECVAACVKAGMPEREGVKMFVHYEMVRWTYGKGKVPISSLSLAVKNWKLGWEDRGCPGPVTPTSPKGAPLPLGGAMVLAKRDELNRILDRMKTITKSYDSHQDMRANDVREWHQLRKRRDDLKKELGMQY